MGQVRLCNKQSLTLTWFGEYALQSIHFSNYRKREAQKIYTHYLLSNKIITRANGNKCSFSALTLLKLQKNDFFRRFFKMCVRFLVSLRFFNPNCHPARPSLTPCLWSSCFWQLICFHLHFIFDKRISGARGLCLTFFPLFSSGLSTKSPKL